MVLEIVSFVLLLFVLTLVAEPIAVRLRLPHSALLVILGAVAGYVITLGFGLDTGLRASNFHDLVFFVLLPVLIFEAAYNVPLIELRSNIGIVLMLAVVGMLLTTCVAAVLLYSGIGHPTGFPWIAALLAGSLLAATDPVAVVAQLKTLGAPERLAVLLEGESLFNDAAAIVLFGLFLALSSDTTFEPLEAVSHFLIVFLGGSLVGLMVGFAAAYVFALSNLPLQRTVITLCTAYGSFLLAEAVLHVSGVMAVLVAGLFVARSGKKEPSGREISFFWSITAYLANGCVFLLMGITITIQMFSDRWLAMIIAIIAVFLARIVSTAGTIFVMNPFLKNPLSAQYQGIIVWGGLRGAVTLALALSLPGELDYWYTIQSMAFGVVLFTLLVQAPTMPWLLRKTRLVS